TGFYCPGCGVTRMCMAILHLDFSSALHCNPVLFFLIPVLVPFFLHFTIRYIKKGTLQTSKAQNVILWLCITALLLFGIIRNIAP
ncbi:MAG: DUF2752 domain-containing protein, partial [Lachnospiraceae bacterium]